MSYKFFAAYVKIQNPNHLTQLRSEKRLVHYQTGENFACVAFSSAEIEEADEETLQSDSTTYGEAIFIQVYAVVNLLEYQHWSNGQRTRWLYYIGGSDGWNTVAGTPEAWEQETFFSAKALEKAIEYAAEDGINEKALRAQWQSQEILIGGLYPICDEEGVPHIIAQHFGFSLFPQR